MEVDEVDPAARAASSATRPPASRCRRRGARARGRSCRPAGRPRPRASRPRHERAPGQDVDDDRELRVLEIDARPGRLLDRGADAGWFTSGEVQREALVAALGAARGSSPGGGPPRRASATSPRRRTAGAGVAAAATDRHLVPRARSSRARRRGRAARAASGQQATSCTGSSRRDGRTVDGADRQVGDERRSTCSARRRTKYGRFRPLRTIS